MKINCVCNKCKEHYKLFFDEENQLCQDCFQKMLNYHGKNIQFEIDKLKRVEGQLELTLKKRKTKLYQFKQITYYLLFNTPILFYFTVRYGFIAEILYVIGVLIWQLSMDWSEWCADRL